VTAARCFGHQAGLDCEACELYPSRDRVEVDRHTAINRLTDSIASGALSDGHVRLVLELVAALTREGEVAP
jgi:hypothetical protein